MFIIYVLFGMTLVLLAIAGYFVGYTLAATIDEIVEEA